MGVNTAWSSDGVMESDSDGMGVYGDSFQIYVPIEDFSAGKGCKISENILHVPTYVKSPTRLTKLC